MPPSALGRGINQALSEWDYSQDIPLPESIPTSPSDFYKSFGYLSHPITRQPVRDLADYQYNSWRLFLEHGRVLEVKSHRVGESSKWMLVDFQLAVLPSDNPLSTRGFDTMLLAPTKPQAVEILRDFRRRALKSKRYSPFILDKPSEISEYGELSPKAVLRDEKTKTAALYIRNPEDPLRPSRIIALGADNAGSLESWPNFKHLHISDITATRGDYTEALNIALTRIGNTNGTVVIETIPGKPYGPIYDMSRRLRGMKPVRSDFAYFEVTAEQAVAAGVMSKDFLESERRRLTTSDFNGLYGAQFSSATGNVFKTADIEQAIELGKQLQEKYGLKSINRMDKCYGGDAGFGSSNFGECVVQLIDGYLQVILAEESEHPNHSAKVRDIFTRMQSWNIKKAYIDGSNASVIRDLKGHFRESTEYEGVDEDHYSWMTVRPVPFNKYHKEMLGHSQSLMQRGRVAISPSFTKLIDACRTATEQDGKLDKEATLYDDLFDAFRLALFRFKIQRKEVR